MGKVYSCYCYLSDGYYSCCTLRKKQNKWEQNSEPTTEYSENSVIPEEDEEAYDLPPRVLNSDVVPYDGQRRAISCWGDSMMFGIGAGEAYVSGSDEVLDISGWTTPDTLEYLTGIKVYNLGVSGKLQMR